MLRKIISLVLLTLSIVAITGCGPDSNSLNSGDHSRESLKEARSFYLDANGWDATTATLRKITKDIQTRFGKKTLKIWVSNDCYGDRSTKSYHITPEMVDALADAFLQEGEDNDIYDWDTAIYGEEWGDAAHEKYANVIGETDTIDILLTDIDGDNNPNAGTIGYFYAKDNYANSSISGSNERIMFYIDAVMFANDTGGFAGWDIRDRFPAETLSTLAHEFQHMIHFYQKTVLLANGNSSETWLDEMLAETTEDIVATRIGIDGPRHVDPTEGSAGEANNTGGRYPRFNAQGSTLSLTKWDSTVADYTKVSAFGTYLIRNYGGAKLLHDIMHNPYTDKQAILNALPSYASFDTLLRKWGVAILLSDQTTLPDGLPHYNTGDFTDTTYNGITYEMGSINFFNYTPEPTVYQGNGNAHVTPMSNLFYEVGTQLSSDTHLDLNLTANTVATLVVKNHSGNGGDTGSSTICTPTSNNSDLDFNITVGDDPAACYLAKGKNLHLDFHISGGSKDLYLVLTNTDDQYIQGADITNPNSRHAKITTTTPQPAIARKQIARPAGMLQRVQEFKRHISAYLIPKAKETL